MRPPGAPARKHEHKVKERLAFIVRRILRPSAEWDAIAGESTTIETLLFRYILPLSLIPAVATVIGILVFGVDWNPLHGYALPRERVLAIGAALQRDSGTVPEGASSCVC